MKKPVLSFLLIFSLIASVCGQPANFPYRLSPTRDALLITAGSLLMQASAIGQNRKVKMEVSEIAMLDATLINPIDRFAIRYWSPDQNSLREKFEPGSMIVAGAGIGTYGIWSRVTSHRWEAAKTLGLMYIEGLYICSGTMLLAKSLIDRARPYTYNPDLTLSERSRGANNESFFSGNANILFYNSVFISKVFSDLFPESRLKPLIWGATLSLATFSGILSVGSGWHFPTDVMVGALVGGLAGYLIPVLHKSEAQKHLLVMPWASSSSCGLSLSFAL